MIARSAHSIYHSNNIRDVLKHCSFNSWLILDLDNTVYESIGDLGSDQWYTRFFEYAVRVTADHAEAFSLVIAIYDAVQYHISHKAVENHIVGIIRMLQDIGIPVLGLTARSNRISDVTLEQLNEIGIDFARFWGQVYMVLGYIDRQTPVFHDGIIFCDGLDKGKCLSLFLTHAKLSPDAVVMADDKEKHLHSVKAVVENGGGSFVGIRYGYLDAKAAALDLQKVTLELHKISHKLPDNARVAIERLNITAIISSRPPSPLRDNSMFPSAAAVKNEREQGVEAVPRLQ